MLGALSVAQPAMADDTTTASSKVLVDLDLRDARLEEAIAALTMRSPDINIVIQNVPGKSFLPVNVKLVGQPLEKALRLVAASAGAVIDEDEGIYHLRMRGENEPDPVAAVRAATAPAVVVPVSTRPVSPHQFVAIRLSYMKPSDFKRVLSNPDALAMIESDMPDRSGPPPVWEPKQDPSAAKANLPAYDPHPNLFHNLEQNNGNNAVGTTGVSAGQNSPSFSAAGQAGIPGGPGGFAGPGGIGGQQGAGANGRGGGALTPQGIDNIISNDADNTLIVQGDAAGIDELRQIIRLLDIAPKQVFIRAEFVRVDLNEADGFGITWTAKVAPNLNFATANIAPAGSITAVYASGNAVANLQAQLTKNHVNILQAPLISTSNNRQAFVNFSTNVPIQQSTTNITPQGQQITNTTTQYLQVSNGLNVTPHINGDNSVSLFVSPQLSTFAPSDIPGAPQISNQTLSTYRRIANGETMVLGGFITTQDNYGTNEVPLLSKLPIIGSLFRSYSHSVQNSEVLIFLTPEIIEDRAQGVVGAGTSSPSPTP